MDHIREFDPILRPPSLSDRARKAVELTHKLRSHARRRTAHLSKAHKVLITTAAIASFFFLALVVPSATTACFVAFGFWQLDQAQSQLDSFEFASAKSSADSAASAFNLASGEAAELQFPLSLIGHRNLFMRLDNFLFTQVHFASSIFKFSDAADSISSLAGSVMVTDTTAHITSSRTSSVLTKASADLKDSVDQLNISKNKEPLSHSTITSLFGLNHNFQDTFAALQSSQQLLYQIINLWPEAVSSSGEKKYLVLVADSHALNTGGGNIVGAGLLTFQQGRLRSIVFDDVPLASFSSPDFQSFLGRSGVNLASFSSSPDYSSAASVLLKASASGNFAGILALDDHALSSLLTALGPVHPAGYQLEINADNITQLAHAQLNPDPSAKSILTATTSKVISKIFNSPTKEVKSISSSILASLTSKHLLAYFAAPALNSIAATHDWNGSITPENVLGASTSSTSDFLMTSLLSSGNESGKWQSNLQVDYSPFLGSNGQVQSRLTLTLTNTSSSPTDDTYQESFKIYTPAGSTLINSSAQEMTGQDAGLTTFTIPFSIAPRGSVTVSLIYTLPKFASNPTSYLLHVQKQIGSSTPTLQFHLDSPLPVKISGNQGSFQIDKDSDFHLTLSDR